MSKKLQDIVEAFDEEFGGSNKWDYNDLKDGDKLVRKLCYRLAWRNQAAITQLTLLLRSNVRMSKRLKDFLTGIKTLLYI